MANLEGTFSPTQRKRIRIADEVPLLPQRLVPEERVVGLLRELAILAYLRLSVEMVKKYVKAFALAHTHAFQRDLGDRKSVV